MTSQEICEEIVKLDSLEDLKLISEVVCERLRSVRTFKGSVVMALCKVGDLVEFTSTRTGEKMTGTLKKKKVSYAEILIDGALWNVPFNMITKV